MYPSSNKMANSQYYIVKNKIDTQKVRKYFQISESLPA